MPLGLRLLLLFVLGAAAGRLANWFSWRLVRIQRLDLARAARPARRRGNESPSGTPWLSLVPLLGAWRARRADATRSEPTGWRPLAVEILLGIGVAALYWWEVERLEQLQPLAGRGFVPVADDVSQLHAAFASH
jgi:hypothetical protein